MKNSKTLILIDGHALAFRQYYALERSNMMTSDGTPTWAVFGFFKAIFDLLKNKTLHPDAICVAFDVSHQTFRVEKYDRYKANRVAMPDNMQVQMELIYEGLKAFNIPVYTKEGFEADDVIGTIAKEACELGHKVLILTGDQDAFQLVDKKGCTKVIIPSKGELKEYDWNAVYEKMGVYPNQIVDYKGLCGDTSDNIPGVRGIGEKTAVQLLSEYGTLENIIANCDNIKKKSVRDCICEQKDVANLSYFLATIVRDVDIDFNFASTHIRLPDLSQVTNFLKKLQFYSFLKNIDSILFSFDKKSKISLQKSRNDVNIPLTGDKQVQLGLFAQAVKAEINKVKIEYDSKLILTAADLENLVKVLKTKSLIAFRTEGEVKSAISTQLHGFVVAYNDNFTADEVIKFDAKGNAAKTFYIPAAHYLDNQLKQQDIIEALKPIFEDESIKKTTYDAKIEHSFLKTLGIDVRGIIFDVLLASYVKDPSRTHLLEVQAMDNIEHAMNEDVPYTRISKTNISILNLSIENALEYTSDSISTILELTRYWINHLDERELKLLYNVEVPLAVVLADMEYNGIFVDVNYLNELSVQISDKLRSTEFKIYKIAGKAFNVVSPKQVAEILYETLKLTPHKNRSRTRYSTNADVLEELSREHEIAKLILQSRKFAKLKSTYTDALPSLINPIDNRIHTTYNQTTTATGRLSSSDPNLQNIPVRTEEGNKIRKAFTTQDKQRSLILSADYSQIELRILAHVSQDEHLIDAFKTGVDIHQITAAEGFDVPLDEVTREMRYKAKAVNFGIVYGQSKYGLAKSLGIPVEDAELFINKYFATYPDVKKYMDDMVRLAAGKGYVETSFGRKRYLTAEFRSTNAAVREFAKRAAINQPMQGTAADLIKMAMVDLAKRMEELGLKSKLVMQVHDELVIEVEKDELEVVKKIVIEAMSLNQPLSVPLVVDISVGETWQE